MSTNIALRIIRPARDKIVFALAQGTRTYETARVEHIANCRLLALSTNIVTGLNRIARDKRVLALGEGQDHNNLL